MHKTLLANVSKMKTIVYQPSIKVKNTPALKFIDRSLFNGIEEKRRGHLSTMSGLSLLKGS